VAEKHRIKLDDLLGEDYAGEWVDIHKARTWGARLKVQDAARGDVSDYKLTVLDVSIVGWSRSEPHERSAYEALAEEAGEALFEAITGYYASRRRAADASKSAVAAGADEPGERAA